MNLVDGDLHTLGELVLGEVITARKLFPCAWCARRERVAPGQCRVDWTAGQCRVDWTAGQCQPTAPAGPQGCGGSRSALALQ